MPNPELDKLIKPEPLHGGLKFLLWIVALVLISIIAWFTIDLTGLQAWKQHVVAMRSQGVELDGDAYAPPQISDAKNAFKSPTLESIAHKQVAQSDTASRLLSEPSPFAFTKPPSIADLGSWDAKGNGMPTEEELNGITDRPETPAHFILNHYEPLEAAIAEIHSACDLPRSRLDLDYASWADNTADFVALRQMAQTFCLRARANLALGNTVAALDDLNVVRRLALASEGRPTTIVQGMIETAIAGLMVNVIEEAIREGALSVDACEALKEQLAFFDLPASFVFSIKKGEIPGVARMVMDARTASVGQGIHPGAAFIPDGVIQRNLIVHGETLLQLISAIDLPKGRVDPKAIDEHEALSGARFKSFSPSTFLARIIVPSLSKAAQNVAKVEMRIRLARIACTLESFRLEHDVFPETLTDLSPDFIHPLPIDIVTGTTPSYRLTGPSEYQLYSVGWNRQDDGGEAEDDKDWIWNGGLSMESEDADETMDSPDADQQ